jgi:sarcosine oxidase, subunit alpha
VARLLGARTPRRSFQLCRCSARSAGACRGTFGLAATLDEGYLTGKAAAHAVSRTPGRVCSFNITDTQKSYRGMIGACPMDRPRGSVFVDFQHDVTVKDLTLATQEGFRSIEHVKRYTTTGMATDQGKTSNVNALAIVANQLGKPVPQVGLTTFRQPYTPVTFGMLAGYGRGDLFDPIRRTPIDSWAQEKGAVFEDVGPWKRALLPQGRHRRRCRWPPRIVFHVTTSTGGALRVLNMMEDYPQTEFPHLQSS